MSPAMTTSSQMSLSTRSAQYRATVYITHMSVEKAVANSCDRHHTQ
jgi:hypothetical protein